jgi:hypothetical protein
MESGVCSCSSEFGSRGGEAEVNMFIWPLGGIESIYVFTFIVHAYSEYNSIAISVHRLPRRYRNTFARSPVEGG